MKIYTRTGDRGETDLLGAQRVAKDSVRIEACGTVDELNAVLGMARAENPPQEVDRLLEAVQNDLFNLGAELAATDAEAMGLLRITARSVVVLEEAIDRFEAKLSALGGFILPGGTKGAAVLQLARTVCRRAERRVVALAKGPDETVSDTVAVYLNRLGDLLFVLARAANAAAGQSDVPWHSERDD